MGDEVHVFRRAALDKLFLEQFEDVLSDLNNPDHRKELDKALRRLFHVT